MKEGTSTGNPSTDDVSKQKSHRERKSGRKAERKKKKERNDNEGDEKQKNPKAFAFNSAVKAERRFRRKQDIETKKQHVPLVDRTPLEPPPILIGVVGPPKVGKSTLINSLIKMFTKCPLTNIKGPVTVVTGKKRRMTLIECNNDINSMIDLAKVADLILLMCDASFGFEMEIFEFLNICQVHGMPRIMGVLTHLDMIKNSKTIKVTKKLLKHRFWTEVYAGAKLFYLSGILHGEYLRNEVKNLGRFISVIKLRPLIWRASHSYLVGDRYEDLTNQELIRKNPKCDRNISLYGYVRGVPLNKDTSVHIAGLGDLQIHDISFLPDPCPLPETIKKRALIEKEKLIYAPFSGVGGIVYDKDAVYIELGGSHSHQRRDDSESNNILSNLINTKETLDVKLQHSELQIFSEGVKLKANDIEAVRSISELNVEDRHQHLYKAVEETELDRELKSLRTHSSKNINGSSSCDKQSNESNNSTDSEMSDNNQESKNVSKSQSQYTVLKENKDSKIHSKLTSVLKNLEKPQNDTEDKRKNITDEKLVDNISNKFCDNSMDDDDSSESDDIMDDDDDDIASENNAEPSQADNDFSLSVSEKPNTSSSEGEESGAEDDLQVKWKNNLAKKAQNAFWNRHNRTRNLMKIVYGIFDSKFVNRTNVDKVEDNPEDEEIGGLFKVISKEQQKQKLQKDEKNLMETSLFESSNNDIRNWLELENKSLIENCFVTGKWKDSEDAAELLKIDAVEDMMSDDSEVYGDFEDLETGEKYNLTNKTNDKLSAKEKTLKRGADTEEVNETTDKNALAEKKRKLKEKFDNEYDNNDKTFYDESKVSMEKQSQLNKTIFENLPDEVRVQIEGYRPGMYVRIEFQNVPAEFINNFDPTYPLVIGALNMGEENVGYVNVKVKKHRWYKKILKTNDPLIISLGWRRFQTLPIYSKLEDDLKFRYLKYTPQHVTCNAHFWGPITPQGTGFLALQSCDENSEFAKQGFRIAATGSVQELDKSTQIMKKLKLIGHPLKIYKKTAFIKGMFNSDLEVAQFEGAKIKTVSGIRGQIKKAVRKPEGCFRATFEDKIQLSDIVFCRTWFKVDVSQFYNPVTTLLLTPENKNSWRGLRTTGQIKREDGIRNQPNKDSLYVDIVRDAKVFKPLVIPSKLQRALPYRDKPKYGTLSNERNKEIDRVAVIREPREQQVSNMMKMLRASFDHKQVQLQTTVREKMDKYKKGIEEQELNKMKKFKQQKKVVMRTKSKAQISAAKKSSKKR